MRMQSPGVKSKVAKHEAIAAQEWEAYFFHAVPEYFRQKIFIKHVNILMPEIVGIVVRSFDDDTIFLYDQRPTGASGALLYTSCRG